MIAYDMVWDVSDIIAVMEVLSRDFKGSMTVMWYHILSVISYDIVWDVSDIIDVMMFRSIGLVVW